MDKFPEAFKRYETEVGTDRIRSFDHLKRSFRYWSGRNWKGSDKQIEALKREARRLGIAIPREKPKPIGISRRKGVPREELKLHYTVHKVRGKTRIVARIPKGMKGAGRFAKRG